MPWLLQHRCEITDSEPKAYGLVAIERYGGPITLVSCNSCREQFEIIGHDWFQEAIGTHEDGHNVLNLPTGFVVPHGKKN